MVADHGTRGDTQIDGHAVGDHNVVVPVAGCEQRSDVDREGIPLDRDVRRIIGGKAARHQRGIGRDRIRHHHEGGVSGPRVGDRDRVEQLVSRNQASSVDVGDGLGHRHRRRRGDRCRALLGVVVFRRDPVVGRRIGVCLLARGHLGDVEIDTRRVDRGCDVNRF